MPDSTQNPILACTGISKSYRSGQQSIDVLHGVDLELFKGDSLSIRGESGSGKTTLLNILSGLENAESGTLLWQGENVVNQSLNSLSARRKTFLGLIFQAYYLIPELNALENVMFPARLIGGNLTEAKRRATDLMAAVGLVERRFSRPDQLSGGEKQRVAVARALMNRPPIVMADEPTGNLDERTGAVVMELLLQICRDEGTSLILVTHSTTFASLTARQLFLHAGRMENEVPGNA